MLKDGIPDCILFLGSIVEVARITLACIKLWYMAVTCRGSRFFDTARYSIDTIE